MYKRTKIVCTIGPASETVPVLKKLLKAGMNVARLNFSHGTYAHHRMLIRNIRCASKETGIPVALLQDLQGPRIRIGTLPKEGVSIKQGERVVLIPEIHPRPPFIKEGRGGFKILPQQYRGLARDVQKGTPILIADGAMKLVVDRVEGDVIFTHVVTGGIVKSHKGLNVPGVSLGAKSITKKDADDLAFGLRQGVDFVTLSFVRDAEDMVSLQRLMKRLAPIKKRIPKTVAKIERPEAVKNIRRIVEVADVIMIGRGDLALEADPAKLILMQKDIIAACRNVGKPVIVATQMLESMMVSPRPTRAEISDITNAAIDHADATMLSGETASGQYPVESCSTMAAILKKTEQSRYDNVALTDHYSFNDHGMGVAVARLIRTGHLRLLLIAPRAVESSLTSFVQQRPEVPIVPIVRTAEHARSFFLLWGVTPIVLATRKLTWMFLSSQMKKAGLAKRGDRILLFDDEQEGVFGGEQISVKSIS